MTYYYYDKVLVSNCKLNSLTSFAGKMKRDAVIQLSAQLVDEEDAVLAGSEEVSIAEDFYQITIAGKVTYRIHKGGNLMRAYAVDYSWIEKTVAFIPASILAVIHGKILLKGSLLPAREWAYALVGERGSGESEDDAVMLLAADDQYIGVVHFYQLELDIGIDARGLMGIFSLRQDRDLDAIVPIQQPEIKRECLLKNVIGYDRLTEDLRQRLNDSAILKGLSNDLFMAFMLVM